MAGLHSGIDVLTHYGVTRSGANYKFETNIYSDMNHNDISVRSFDVLTKYEYHKIIFVQHIPFGIFLLKDITAIVKKLLLLRRVSLMILCFCYAIMYHESERQHQVIIAQNITLSSSALISCSAFL